MGHHIKPPLWRALFGLLSLPLATSAHAILINEIRIDQPGSDRDEYFELIGQAGESLNDLSYLVIGDAGRSNSGVIESLTRLDGLQIDDDGYFLVAENSFSLAATPDYRATLKFENSDNVTHLLVSGLDAGAGIGDDLDLQDDGILHYTPWNGILDSLALVESFGSGDKLYSTTQIGDGTGRVPYHAFRNAGAQAGAQMDWRIGERQTQNDTPGNANPATSIPAPTTASLLALGLLALRRRAAKPA